MKKIVYHPKQVRIFLLLLLAFAVLLTFRLTRHSPAQTRVTILLVEAALIGGLMAVPRIFFPVFKIILIGSGFLGNFVFAVISILVFYVIVTPIALAMKLSGKKFMSSRIDPCLPTYYEEGEERFDIEKQF